MSIGPFEVEVRHGGIDGGLFPRGSFCGWIFLRIRSARVYLTPATAPSSGAVCLSPLSS
jgi:hypothetical protein